MKKQISLVLVLLFAVVMGSGNVAGATCGEMKAYIPFNGTTAQDYSGCNQQVSQSGSVTTGVTGEYGEAFSFDGTDDQINISSLHYNGTGTVLFWLKPDNSAGTLKENYFSNNNGNNDALVLQNWDDGNSYWGMHNNANFYRFSKSQSFPSGFFYVAFRWNDTSGDYDLLWNGNVVNSATDLPTLDLHNSPSLLMVNNNGNRWSAGDLDEFRYYNDFLTNSEIQNLNNTNSLTVDHTPSLSNPDPSDGATGVNDTTDGSPVDVDLSIDYSDPDSDSGNVTFKWQNGSVIDTITGVASGSSASTTLQDLKSGTTYNWQVEATDGENSTTAGNYSFTTAQDSSLNTVYSDGFENGNLDYYSGTFTDFSVKQDSSFSWNGDYYLNVTNSGSNPEIFTDNITVSQGDKIVTYVRGESSSDTNNYQIKFGVQDNNNYYLVNPVDYATGSGNNDEIQIYKKDAGSFTKFSSNASNSETAIPKNQWLKVETKWTTNNWINSSINYLNGTTILSVDTQDSTFTSGGIGYRSASGITLYDANRSALSSGGSSSPPDLDITNPVDGSSLDTITRDLNYTTNASFSQCQYTLSGGQTSDMVSVTNKSITCGSNVSGLIPEVDQQTWRVWGQYSSNNSWIKDEVTFTVNSGNADKYIEVDPLVWQKDVASLLSVDNLTDYNNRKSEIIDFIYKSDGSIPSRNGSIQRDIPDSDMPTLDFSTLPNVSQVDEITVESELSTVNEVYWIKNNENNGRVLIHSQGHSGDFSQNGGRETIDRALSNGYDVLAVQMPLNADNTGNYASHNDLADEGNSTFSPLKVFLDQYAVSLNRVESESDYSMVSMTGISGGGWATSLYPAMDERVDRVYPVSGSYPLYINGQNTAPYGYGGDYEQGRNFGGNNPLQSSFYNGTTTSFLDLYVMGGKGDGDKFMQISNRDDSCCFWGVPYKTYTDPYRQSPGDVFSSGNLTGGFEVKLDTTHASHKISNWARDQIFGDLSGFNSRPVTSYTSGTVSDGGSINKNYTVVNISVRDDSSISSVDLEFNGTNSSMNKNGDYYTLNETGLEDGKTYDFRTYTTDSGGKSDVLNQRSFSVDIISNPAINSQNIFWNNIGGSEMFKVNLSLSSSGDNDIKNYTSIPSGSVTEFTNSSLQIDSPSKTFDWNAKIGDSEGLFSSVKEVNYTANIVSKPFQENTTGVVNTSVQIVNASANIDVRGSCIDVDVNFSSPSNLKNELSNGVDTSCSSGVVEADYYAEVDSIETNLYPIFQDSNDVSDTDTQYLRRNKEISELNGINYSRVSVDSPSIDGSCSDCGSRSVSLDGGSSKNVSYNSNGDWIENESSSDLTNASSKVVYGQGVDQNYTSRQNITVANNRSDLSLEVDISSAIPNSNGCSVDNSTSKSVSASTEKKFEIFKDCKPAEETDWSIVKSVNNNVTSYEYNGTVNVFSERTSEVEQEYWAKKSRFNQFSSKKDSSVNFSIDSVESGVEVRTDSRNGNDYIVFKALDNRTNSSIHSGSHYFFYEYSVSDSSDGDGGSGGSGGSGGGSSSTVSSSPESLYNWNITLLDTEFDGVYRPNVGNGESFEKSILIESEDQVDIDISCEDISGGLCSSVTPSVSRVEFDSSGQTEVSVTGTVPEDADRDEYRFKILFTDPQYDSSSDSDIGLKSARFIVNTQGELQPLRDYWGGITGSFSVSPTGDDSYPIPNLLISLIVTGGLALVGGGFGLHRKYPKIFSVLVMLIFLIIPGLL